MNRKKNFKKEILDLYQTERDSKILIISRKYRVSLADAEDFYQRAFIKALKNADKFRGDSSLKTWMFRIIHNTALDTLRSVSRKKTSSIVNEEGINFLDQISDAALNPSQQFEYLNSVNFLKDKILEAKNKLNPMHKAVFELAFEKNKTYEQIAKTLKCPKGTIMSRIFYARKNFIKYYKNISEKINVEI